MLYIVAGVCITTDVDTLLYHMNNARYLRELDFARVDFYERTGLYKTIRKKGGAVVQGACTIRYRRFVRPFSIFKITSKVHYIAWYFTIIDAQWIYDQFPSTTLHCLFLQILSVSYVD